MSLEQWAYSNLAKDLPGLRQFGLKPTIYDAISWADPNYTKEYLDEYVWARPSFVPDATRWRKCVFSHAQQHKTPCVELWEIEDSNKVSKKKLEAIESWFFRIWDGEMYPQFELWVCDRWGNARFRVISTAEDHYGVSLVDFCEAKEAA
jgi:hypothetical protein